MLFREILFCVGRSFIWYQSMKQICSCFSKQLFFKTSKWETCPRRYHTKSGQESYTPSQQGEFIQNFDHLDQGVIRECYEATFSYEAADFLPRNIQDQLICLLMLLSICCHFLSVSMPFLELTTALFSVIVQYLSISYLITQNKYLVVFPATTLVFVICLLHARSC